MGKIVPPPEKGIDREEWFRWAERQEIEQADYIREQGGAFFCDDFHIIGLVDAIINIANRAVSVGGFDERPPWIRLKAFIEAFERDRAASYVLPDNADQWTWQGPEEGPVRLRPRPSLQDWLCL